MVSRLEPPRILIVDPDGRSRLRMASLLEEDGFWVEESDDFSDVCTRLDAGVDYDIVIAEAGPNGEGGSLAREVSLARPAIATILIERGDANGGAGGRAIQVGAFDVLDPEFSAAALRLGVERACTRRHLLLRDRQAERHLQSEILRRESALLGRHGARSELWLLAEESTASSGGDTMLGSFCRFAREAFDLDTAAVVVTRSDGLHFAAFSDRKGRSPSDALLESRSGSSLASRLSWNRSSQTNPPREWCLVDGNRGTAFWPIAAGRGGAFLYTAADSRDVAVRDRDAALFAVLRARVQSRFEESGPDGMEDPRNAFLVSARRFIRRLEQTMPGEADSPDGSVSGRLWEHAMRIERYATILGRRSGWFDNDAMFRLAAAGLLHDIGKVPSRPPSHRSGRGATPSEYERTLEREHPVIGGRIVRGLPNLDLEPAVRHHHEHYDGTGFPDGLRGNSIPVEAQILLAADSFDHMIEPGSGNNGLATDEAVDEIAKNSGRRFAPAVVDLVSSCAVELRRDDTNRQPSIDLAEAS